ncbi:MAG: tRNA (adenosine(37)-N6)-threonylcarbamoyltransferase complex transferase subunit TsaD [Deltaproteobacteria bacterium]|nr:MAG: tRNA (adenosine(37)-N6)-threonylcarbamoyltransferase complex transferase subunit TsaD [Deltaproteobacteria bacterium]
MLILGIDTSCDDTSAAIVEDGCRPLSSVVNSQVKLHHPYGGVVPELASREHLKNIVPVVEESLSRASVSFRDLDGIAVTVGPGLVGALLVGLYYAKGLALAHRLPLVGINHLEGHILSIFLEKDFPSFPFIAITISGGHTSIYLVEGYGRYTQMGQTLDDAAGESFDKVAKILGLGYPGGVAIEREAGEGKKDRIKFPRAMLGPESLDFSFSGVKTSVALYVKDWKEGNKDTGSVTLADIAASFQEAVVDVLVRKCLKAVQETGVRHIVVAGGVACNGRLRERFSSEAVQNNLQLFYPSARYCTDNGAMIAVAGYHRILNNERMDLSQDVRSKFPIQDLRPLSRGPAQEERQNRDGMP